MSYTLSFTGDQVDAAIALAGRERRHEWADPYDYCGTALAGTAESAEAWTITRIEVAADGTTTTTSATAVAWDDRATASYS